MKYNSKLLCTIKKLGKNLSSINLLIVGEEYEEDELMINFIIEGCPKLKTLTLESLRGWKESPLPFISEDIVINKESLKALYKGCKELKDLKITRVLFWDIFTELTALCWAEFYIKEKGFPGLRYENSMIIT